MNIAIRKPWKHSSGKLCQFSENEQAVIILTAYGFKNADIAGAVNTTEHCVKNYLRGIYEQLGLDNRVQLAMWYIKNVEECQ